ncbi:MAG: hypothetical protein WBB45_10985 [Cyclobacteriaceae bacterium]
MRSPANYLTVLILACLLSSCDEPFYPDILEPALPAATEIGANSAGAFINGEPWMTTSSCSFPNGCDREITIQAFVGNQQTGLGDSTVIVFGEWPGAVSFHFPGRLFESIDDLTDLRDSTFVVDGTEISAFNGAFRGNECTSGTLDGLFHIRYTELIVFDGRRSLIFSGTFGFVHLDPGCGEEAEVLRGRYDFKLDQDDFIVDFR